MTPATKQAHRRGKWLWQSARGLLGSVAIVIAGLALAGPLAAQTAGEQKRVVLRFLTDSDYPPFNYHDVDGVLAGFNVDLARAICLDVGAACDIRVVAWDELIPTLRRGEADAIVAGHAVLPKALALVDFSDRYFHTPGRFAGRKGGTRVDMTPEGLDGTRIGVAKGSPHEAYLRAFFYDSSIQAFDTVELAREAMIQGKIEYVFEDGISLAFWVNGTASKECCELKGGPFLEPKFFGDGIAIAVAKNDPQVKALINTSLKRIRASGRFDELIQRHFPTRIY